MKPMLSISLSKASDMAKGKAPEAEPDDDDAEMGDDEAYMEAGRAFLDAIGVKPKDEAAALDALHKFVNLCE